MLIRQCAPARLAIICTHPIQYHAPLFRYLAENSYLEIKVFYGWEGPGASIDQGFGQAVQWDIPLLEGYDYEFIKNVAANPGSHHYRGIDLPSLNARVESWSPDAVLIYGWRYRAHLAAMRNFKGKIPVLFRGDSILLDERPGLKKILRRRALRWVYRNVDRALYVGRNNRAYFDAHGLKEEQLCFVPHAVDNARFELADDGEVEKIRLELGIHPGDRVILFAGKLEPKKAPDLLLDAFHELDREGLHLVFVGSGELESTLRQRARQNVHFLGFKNQSQMPVLYRTSDVVILPSRGPGETWGLSLNEAMACGRAVMASDRVGAAVDLIQPGENGWIFEANQIESLTHCLVAASSMDRSELALMGDASRRMIESWSIETQCSAIVEIMQFAHEN